MGSKQYPREKGSRAPWHADAISMFKSGRSQTDIANKHGVSRERVRQVLVSYGGHVSRPTSDEVQDNIIKLYDSGLCLDEISSKLSLRFKYVSRVFTLRGVRVHPVRRKAIYGKILSLASKGSRVSDIAKDLGLTYRSVFIILQRYLDKKEFTKIVGR